MNLPALRSLRQCLEASLEEQVRWCSPLCVKMEEGGMKVSTVGLEEESSGFSWHPDTPRFGPKETKSLREDSSGLLSQEGKHGIDMSQHKPSKLL